MAFNGTWKAEKNENYDKFMEQLGVNAVKRKLAGHDNLKITIQQDGNKFTVKESSAFRTKDIEFTLGVAFDYTLADGTELNGSWTIEGDKLVGKFTRKDNSKALLTTREIIGGELVQFNAFRTKDIEFTLGVAFDYTLADGTELNTYSYDGVDAKRFFKKE